MVMLERIWSPDFTSCNKATVIAAIPEPVVQASSVPSMAANDCAKERVLGFQ